MKTHQEMRKTIELIFQAWIMFPEVRLGQLLINATSLNNQDIFYVEDHELEVSIKEFVDKTLAFKMSK